MSFDLPIRKLSFGSPWQKSQPNMKSKNEAVFLEKPKEPRVSWLKKLGPGLITGAADDDPSGIATYSQAGAQFGLNTLWTLLLTFPLMVGIQIISARIGRVTGHGLATNVRRHYPKSLLFGIVALLLIQHHQYCSGYGGDGRLNGDAGGWLRTRILTWLLASVCRWLWGDLTLAAGLCALSPLCTGT